MKTFATGRAGIRGWGTAGPGTAGMRKPRRFRRMLRVLAALGGSLLAGVAVVVLDATLTVFPLAPVCLDTAGMGGSRIEPLHPHWPFPPPLYLDERLMRRAAVRAGGTDTRLAVPGIDAPVRAVGRRWLAPRHLRHRGEMRVLATQALADRALPVWRQTPIVALATPARPMLLDCAVARAVWPAVVGP